LPLMVLSALVISPFPLVQLVFPCCDDELQQFAHALARSLFCAGGKAQLTPCRHMIDQRLARGLTHAERSGQVESRIHKALGRQRTGSLQAINNELDPWFAQVTDLLSGEIYAFHQATGIDPLLTCVPALNARRI